MKWHHVTYIGFGLQCRDYVYGVQPCRLAPSLEVFCLISSAVARTVRDRKLLDALIDYSTWAISSAEWAREVSREGSFSL